MGNTAPKCGAIKQKKQPWTQKSFSALRKVVICVGGWRAISGQLRARKGSQADWYCTKKKVGHVFAETCMQARQTHSLTASGVWCSRRLAPWLRDYKQGMTGDGTECTHQELTIHHIKRLWEKPMWPTERHWKQWKKGKGGGVKGRGGTEWVGGWLKGILSNKIVCWRFICQTLGTSFPLFLLLAFKCW